LTSLRHAHQLYGGALLEDDVSGAWFLDSQRRLHLEHNGLLERLGTLLLEHGQLAESARLGEQLITEDPCRETGHQLLMRVYAALQQPHLVAQQYHRCAEILQRELSVMPTPATTELFQRLVPVQ
jgi:DNA-binding SARP family transcriptional activator